MRPKLRRRPSKQDTYTNYIDHRMAEGLVNCLVLHRELVGRHVDLGYASGRANAGDKLLTLVASALAGGDRIDDADALRAGGTGQVLGCAVKARPHWVASCGVSGGAM